MFHKVSLIFGYDNYTSSIVVTPESMLLFLREPFSRWLYSDTWKKYKDNKLSESEFHNKIYESTSCFNDEDFYFDPKDAEWLGFRIELDQKDAEAEVEFVFTTNHIGGEIRPDLDKIALNAFDNLVLAKRHINEILSQIKQK